MTSVSDIRRSFLDYFEKNGHEIIASSPLVPHNDPTLLFTNSGMVQFKGVFTGSENRSYQRAVTSQKCVRAGGKHNDLDNVGYTARHHTFFEMLGNFSFGDYFKDYAIELAWKLVTKEFDLSPDRLLVTVYKDDEDAAKYWKTIAGLPEDRIIRIASDDNYWRMGEIGPCGPCSEIFFDHGEGIEGGPPGSLNASGDRFIEIWNLVFMQFEERADGTQVSLPNPSIDTGMGLERIAAILQGKHDNYDTDLLQKLIVASAEVSGVSPDGKHSVSHRVIADHLRASSFLVADGVLPSNEGRGYVLRRIMRRAMRHVHILGVDEPMLFRLVPDLIREMGQHFPELERAQALIIETLKLEETRFRVTLDRGLRLLEEELRNLPTTALLPGKVAFRLYDTYGFPLDLTQDVLRAQDRDVDVKGFNTAMEYQRKEARAAWTGSGESATDEIWYSVRERVRATEFLGYSATEAEGEVRALLAEGIEINKAEEGCEVELVMNQTPFYGNSGGQSGDQGTLCNSNNTQQLFVTDTVKRLGDIHVHIVKIKKGTINIGDVLVARVDKARRKALMANHSATHLLHAALRQVLGDHVVQKGSLVAPERLRFDLSHSKPLTESELTKIEDIVNAEIRSNQQVFTAVTTPEEAVKQGALALFGEKYGAEVRVVSMGSLSNSGAPYSVELCGGTHVLRTGDIGFFKIVSESAVAAGVRRIEATSGFGAQLFVRQIESFLRDASIRLKTTPANLDERISNILDQRKQLENELSKSRKAFTATEGSSNQVLKINGIKFFSQQLEGISASQLRGLVDEAKSTLVSGVVVIASAREGKAAVVVGVTNDLVERYNAIDLVRIAADALGGKGGGGRPDMAQAGGPDSTRIIKAIAAIKAQLSKVGA